MKKLRRKLTRRTFLKIGAGLVAFVPGVRALFDDEVIPTALAYEACDEMVCTYQGQVCFGTPPNAIRYHVYKCRDARYSNIDCGYIYTPVGSTCN